MNIAVINIKDILKYGIKLGAIILLIYICTQIFMSSNISKQDKIKEEIEQGVDKVNKHSFTECLDISISLMSYKKQELKEKNILSSDKILAMGAGIFDRTILENTDLVIDEEELTIDDTEELANQIVKLPDDVTIEEVEKNNITPKYNSSYGSVKINNQSDYELTQDILKPDAQITNKKDILIYHTHTCESYTQSKRL
ncbi:MAG: stage II sporulation protein P [Clostridia bacterium]|nr:stage II sporulation protein P [Clostridia bacterium]